MGCSNSFGAEYSVNHSHLKNEKGAALIIVLGLVAIISGWAATAAYEDLISIRRSESAQSIAKAELSCLSALELAKVALREDKKNTQEDSLEEDWAMEPPVFPVDDGLVSAEIVDANRFLNVNDVVTVDAKGQQIPNMPVITILRELFMQLDLDAALVDALVDWVDSDDRPFGAGGAEKASYYDRSYTVKNAPLDRIEELSFIAGFKANDVRLLKEFLVAARSINGLTRVNINTASPEVLMAMFPQLGGNVQGVIEGRPYMAVPAQNSQPGLSGEGYARLGVQSDAFVVKTRAIFGQADWQEAYFLERNGNKINLLWRERLIWQL